MLLGQTREDVLGRCVLWVRSSPDDGANFPREAQRTFRAFSVDDQTVPTSLALDGRTLRVIVGDEEHASSDRGRSWTVGPLSRGDEPVVHAPRCAGTPSSYARRGDVVWYLCQQQESSPGAPCSAFVSRDGGRTYQQRADTPAFRGSPTVTVLSAKDVLLTGGCAPLIESIDGYGPVVQTARDVLVFVPFAEWTRDGLGLLRRESGTWKRVTVRR